MLALKIALQGVYYAASVGFVVSGLIIQIKEKRNATFTSISCA